MLSDHQGTTERQDVDMNLTTITRGSRRGTLTIAERLHDPADPLAAVLNSLHANCFVADLQLTLVWNNRKAARR